MTSRKKFGQFFTPTVVAATLVKWAVKRRNDRILDPSCGDGEFLALHPYSVGIEIDAKHAHAARQRAEASLVHQADFFAWAEQTQERFDAAVGNPPFIRYHGFTGETRDSALRLSSRIGADLPQLSSSWAPFIAVAASLLKKGGRLAFIVPAEIGHASYATPLLRALAHSFDLVHIIAVKKKIFPDLSEDAWLLYADGFGGSTRTIGFSAVDHFEHFREPSAPMLRVGLDGLNQANGKLRRWLLPGAALELYEQFEASPDTYRMGSIADVGIGYVTGANDFFHLRPSQARAMNIPDGFLKVAVRRGEFLPPSNTLTRGHVRSWLANDEPVLLLHLNGNERLPGKIKDYLTSATAKKVREAYKCRNRDPWYAVPGVIVPDGFLTYMSGTNAQIVKNSAGCVATNSVHVVKLRNGHTFTALQNQWDNPVTTLSCEIEGHPLGGGMLKIEPGEARRILLSRVTAGKNREIANILHDGIQAMRAWRHMA